MKGFLHIVEIIIVTLVMFLIISQFAYLPGIKSDWAKAKMFLRGNDILYALDNQGINWLNSSEVLEKFEKILPENETALRYNIEIRNAIKPEIRVGCVCSDQEFFNLQSDLENPSSFSINDGNISFIVEKMDYDDPLNPLDFSVRFDVIFLGSAVFGPVDLNNHLTSIRNYLGNDKGLVEMRDLYNSSVSGDELQEDLFGLRYDWTGMVDPNGNSIGFNSPIFANNTELYALQKYFYFMPNSSGETYAEPHTFPNFINCPSPSNPNTCEKINASDERVLLRQSGTEVPAVIVNNRVINSKGRTVWVSNGLPSGERESLLKTLTAWAAGDVSVISNQIVGSQESVSFSFFKVLNKDMYQPIEVFLSMAYLYM
jgi:hypothetical protein